MMQNSKKKFFKHALIYFCLSFLLGFAFKLIIVPKVVVNVTRSIPLGFYYRYGYNESLSKGDLIEFLPQGSLKSFVIEKGYLKEDMSFLKQVSGFSGNTYEVKGSNFYINDEYIGPVFTTDRVGNALPQIAPGKHEVAEDCILVTTPAAHSFDSRYYGEIALYTVKNKIKPIFTY